MIADKIHNTDSIAFSGFAQQMLYHRYGDPRVKGWGNKWILMWKVQKMFNWFPASTVCIHKDFQPKLISAFRQLEALGLHKEIKTFNGAFSVRPIKGSDSILSVHSWGAAIDLNAAENALGTEGTWSQDFLGIMLQNLIFCGQNWIGRKDPMHFAMLNG